VACHVSCLDEATERAELGFPSVVVSVRHALAEALEARAHEDLLVPYEAVGVEAQVVHH
jgi:hypothetical protein